MNQYDFTRTGGFPLDQDVLKFMQEATADMHKWLSYSDDLYSPGAGSFQWMILSGVGDNGTGGLTDGWVAVDGEILPFRGGLGSFWNIIENRTGIQFETGFAEDVEWERYVEITTTPGTPFSGFKRFEVLWAERFGYMAVNGAWVGGLTGSIAVNLTGSGGNTTGTINYRRNLLTRTLHLNGTLTVGAPGSVGDPPMQHLLGTLPAEYRPAVKAPFTALYRYHDTAKPLFTDLAGVDIIRGLYMEVLPNGNITMGIIKPNAGVTSYAVSFNEIISLD